MKVKITGKANANMKPKRSGRLSTDKTTNAKQDDEIDTSLLQKPVTTSINGLAKVVNVFQNASKEVRDYLSYECDIMYECRVCRSIFRSLSNFITHKRSFCQDKYNNIIHPITTQNNDDNLSIIENDLPGQLKVQNENDTKKFTKKSLNAVIESLAQKQHFGFEVENFSIADLYKEINKYDEKQEKILAIESIPGTSSGVFQTLKTEGSNEDRVENVKAEIKEIETMLEGQTVILGSDGKAININPKKSVGKTTGGEIQRLTCKLCNINFSTQKTLNCHNKFKHKSSRMVYPCLECSDSFSTVWSVYRHLYNVHRKSLPQVRKMRAQIRSKVRRAEELKQKNEETKTALINEQEKIDEENQAWMDNFETDNDIQMCGGCGRRFERKAALNSHSQTCQKRIAARNLINVNRLKRIAAEDKSVEKKNAKVPKLDNGDTDKKSTDKQKSSTTKKGKIGIQIRYDYNKSDKTNAMDGRTSRAAEELKKNDDTATASSAKDNQNGSSVERKVTDDENILKQHVKYESESDQYDNNDDNVEYLETSYSSDALYTIIGIPPVKKENTPKENDNITLELMEPEVVSIRSSDSSPSKDEQDPLSIKDIPDGSDSEIEEILGPSPADTMYDNPCMLDRNNLKIKSNERLLPISQELSEKYKIAEINDNTLKLIKLISSDLPERKLKTLDEQMLNFVNMRKLQCIPCNCRFNNISKLRCHMSLHFNWMRFRCDICSFKSYDKIIVHNHIRDDHIIHGYKRIEAVLMSIPEWETVEHSSKAFLSLGVVENEMTDCTDTSVLTVLSDKKSETPRSITPENCIIVEKESTSLVQKYKGGAKPVKKNRKVFKVKRKIEEVINEDIAKDDNLTETLFGNHEGVEIDPSSGASSSYHSDSHESDLKKMVYEVIFGQEKELQSKTDSVDKSNKLQIEPIDVSNTTSRPVRNRVKPIDKDFIYDLNEFKERTRSVLITNTNRTDIQYVNEIPDCLNFDKNKKNKQKYIKKFYKTVKHFSYPEHKKQITAIKIEPATDDIDSVTVVHPTAFLQDSNNSENNGDDADVYIVENEKLLAIK